VHSGREIARDPEDIAADLEYEREVLDESIRHDYSSSDVGIVPLSRRRPIWHFAGLWLTLQAGFGGLFVGYELNAGGHTLAATIGLTCVAIVIYLCYAMYAAYLGSRTGQTHALLTRSIFGVSGSWIISACLIVGGLGWVGFQANLLAQIFDGLYGWGHVVTIGVILAAVMIFNNLFGFTGITVFARYIVTPLMVLWIGYLLIKGFVTEGSSVLGATPKNVSGLGGWAAIGAVLGFLTWGDEPDFWRYGKPRFMWPLPGYLFGIIVGQLLFTIGGWIMAQLSPGQTFGGSVHLIATYSLFGAFWLAFILAVVGQFAANDGNYYISINGAQNLIGGLRGWKRPYTCLILAAAAAFAAWWVPHTTDGWFRVASFLAATIPAATTIMAVDHFLLPRLFGIVRPMTHVPSWAETSFINIPAVAALVPAMLVGTIGSGEFPGLADQYWYLPAPEGWVLAAVLYIAFVAIARNAPNLRRVLGFQRRLLDGPAVTGTSPIDIASLAERGSQPAGASATPA
jgi:purine-cytosine permease-like protein